jgi:hypothetical protein
MSAFQSRFSRQRRQAQNPSGQVVSRIFGETLRIIEGDDLILTMPRMMADACPGLMKTKYSITTGNEGELKIVNVIRASDGKVTGETVRPIPALDQPFANYQGSADNTMYSAVPYLVALTHLSNASMHVAEMVNAISAILRSRASSQASIMNAPPTYTSCELVIAYVNGQREVGTTFKIGMPSVYNPQAATIPTQVPSMHTQFGAQQAMPQQQNQQMYVQAINAQSPMATSMPFPMTNNVQQMPQNQALSQSFALPQTVQQPILTSMDPSTYNS